MEFIGRESEAGLAIEAVRGTAETTADKWMRKVTANVTERAIHAVDETTRGRLEDGEGRKVVQKYVEGDVEGIVHADAIGYLFANLYGVCVSATVTSGVYTHAFSLGQNIQHPSLTLFAHDGAVQLRKYSNCMVSSLELSAAIDDFLRFTASFGGSAATASTDTPSYDTEYDFVAKDIVVKMADTEAGLSGATAMKCKDITIKWDQGVIRDHVLGSYEPDDNYNGKMAIEGSFTLNFSDTTMRDLFLGDAAKYMSVTVTGDDDIGSGNYPTIAVVLNKVQVMDWNRAGGADELVTEPISFRAFYNPTDSEQSTVSLKNKTSEYDEVPSA
jgi:hypothetical protein